MTTIRIPCVALWLALASAAAAPANAQTAANGAHCARPSCYQTLPAASRFIVLSNFASQAVLDRETRLGVVAHAEHRPLPPDPAADPGVLRHPRGRALGGTQDRRPHGLAPDLPAGDPFDFGPPQSFLDLRATRRSVPRSRTASSAPLTA